MLGGTRIPAEGLGWPQMASDGLRWPRLTRSLLPSLLMASADSTATSVHASMYYNPSTLVSAMFCACNCSCEIWFREIRARQNAVLTPA